MPFIVDLFRVVRTVDGLMALDSKYSDTMKALRDEMAVISSRLARLEAREEIVVEQAKAAAAASASAVMMHWVADMARRIGSLEARTPSLRLDEPG